MTDAHTTGRATLTRLADAEDLRTQLARDARVGLTARPRCLPPKYFYDARGSQLFEDITRLPEYYQTRTETAILERVVDDVVAAIAPAEIVELGSGASRKTRLLLTAMHRLGSGDRYVAFDVSEDAIREATDALCRDYPWLRVDGVVGDFDHHLADIPHGDERKLVAFLGSTIGNFHPDEHGRFLRDVAGSLRPGDGLVLGVDLVKDVAVLEAAYDDAAGVTAAFNRNVLEVLCRELGARIDVDAFTHVARYDAEHAWIEMLLRAERDVVIDIPSLGLSVPFAAGEHLRTEMSCKFTRERVEALFAGAGLTLRRWDTDERDYFAVVLGVPAD